MAKLETCPFCGEPVIMIYKSSENAFMVYHKNAGWEEKCRIIEPIMLIGLSLADAAETWNRRATEND